MSDPSDVASVPAPRPRALANMDHWAVRLLIAWSGLVTAAFAIVIARKASTLGYPIARILFEDQFNTLADGHLIPRAGEIVPPALAVLLVGPATWLHMMAYFPLAHLFGGADAVAIERVSQMIIYQLGTPILYRLLRHAKADRSVALVLAATYAISPVVMTRMLLCNSFPGAQFLLWSELGRIQGRLGVRGGFLIAASVCHPLVGFASVILAFQDYIASTGPQRRTYLKILIAALVMLAIAHFGVLALWSRARPELSLGLNMLDVLTYPVFPFRLGPFWATPVKLFEIAVFVAGSCILLLMHPYALVPAVVDLTYYAITHDGVRDHSQVLTSIGLFTVLGVRAALFEGGTPWKNRALIAGALFAAVYGHAMTGSDGLIALALAPTPPPPHVADIRACVPPGQKRCVVHRGLYAGFVGRCEQVDTYEPADLADLRIDDAETIVFVAPSRLDCDPKNTTCGPASDGPAILGTLAARIRSGQLHAGVCSPWFVLLRSANSPPSDPTAADRLEEPSP